MSETEDKLSYKLNRMLDLRPQAKDIIRVEVRKDAQQTIRFYAVYHSPEGLEKMPISAKQAQILSHDGIVIEFEGDQYG